MTMTVDEIVRDYRTAKKKLNQIKILADLNSCSNREIAKILIEAGESVPALFNNRGRKKAEPVREAFVLDTDEAPVNHAEMTVRQLIEALHWVPEDAVIQGAPIEIRVSTSIVVATGESRTIVTLEGDQNGIH